MDQVNQYLRMVIDL